MEQGKKGRNQERATFAEVFASIKFSGHRSANSDAHWPEPGFADNSDRHVGVAALDDYKQPRSSN